jgi:opacity protein-like surface antigen
MPMSSPKSFVRSLAIAAALGVGAVASYGAFEARAADLAAPFGDPPVSDQNVEFGTGWYIRGDVAYALDTLPNVGELGTFPTNGPTYRSTYSAGLGGGYKFTNWFRADITGDFRQPLLGSDPFTSTTISGTRWDALANVYFDIGTWYGFTPYVGAGVGAAFGRADLTTFNPLVCPPSSSNGCFTSHVQTSLAWALMAGFSYTITPHIYLDFGYRYLNLGAYTFFSANDQQALSALTGNAATARSQVQEFRFGLRYMID